MTTIACDGRSMAGDGYITHGDMVVDTNCKKVFRLNDGRVIGFAGNGYSWKPILDYFNDTSENKAWPKVDNGDMSMLILDQNGTITMYDYMGRAFSRPAPTAIGTGRAYAMGAMRHGANAFEAVEIAGDLDTHSGGAIITYHIDTSIKLAA